MTLESTDVEAIMELIDNRGRTLEFLIPILQDIQGRFGYVPEEAADIVAKELGISPTRVFGVLTFYSRFRLEKPGRHELKVCQGTACHVMGGERILKYLMDKLNVEPGETTEDGNFSFLRVACVGCCGMAPVVVVDDEVVGNSSVLSVDELLKENDNGGN